MAEEPIPMPTNKTFAELVVGDMVIMETQTRNMMDSSNPHRKYTLHAVKTVTAKLLKVAHDEFFRASGKVRFRGRNYHHTLCPPDGQYLTAYTASVRKERKQEAEFKARKDAAEAATKRRAEVAAAWLVRQRTIADVRKFLSDNTLANIYFSLQANLVKADRKKYQIKDHDADR